MNRQNSTLWLTLGVLAIAALTPACVNSVGGFGDTEYLGNVGGVGSAQRPTVGIYHDNVSFWDGDDVTGPPSLKIDLGEQKAYFYKGDQLVGVSRVSTGREGYQTPAGRFKVTEKDIDHRSNLYGSFIDKAGNVVDSDADIKREKAPPGTDFLGAPMYYFMRVTGAVGMHAGYLPGYAASHGCIRLPESMAEKFYQHAPLGTPVTIVH